MCAKFWLESLKGKYHSEGQGVYVRIILKWILVKYDWGVDWINLAQDRNRWRALLIAVMSLWFPSIKCGEFLH
jgi:hypothetical protein